jgi:hypothetical protein
MKTQPSEKNRKYTLDKPGERGSAIVISLFVLALISVFVAFALTRTSAEAAAVGNETAEGRTFYAAQGSLETMTREFNKIFETKLNPSTADITNITTPSTMLTTAMGPNYTFNQELVQTSTRQNVVLTGGPYSGLYAIRDNWRLRTTATDNQGVQVQLTRHLLNSRVPIFQFGVFYDDDLELFNGPPFGFGGRVHSNRHFFLHPSNEGAFFDSRVTAAGHIVTQTKRNGDTPNITSALVQIKNASGVYQQLLPTEGSVLNGTPNVFASDPQLPSSKINPNFATQTAKFDGNLQAETRPLRLPLKLGNAFDLVEMLRRPKVTASAAGGDLFQDSSGSVAPVTTTTADGDIMRSERYANKPGIRISLADSQAKLPGCASGTGTTPVSFQCGIRLDGAIDGLGNDRSATGCLTGDRANPCVRGYRPLPMKNAAADVTFNHQTTRVNGERFYMGAIAGRGVWIKVELVGIDTATQAVITQDITADFLSLGITEQATPITDSGGNTRFDITDTRYTDTGCVINSITATTPQTANTCTDSRSIIKLQRFVVRGPQIPNASTGSHYMSYYDISGGTDINFVERYSGVDNQTEVNGACASGCSATGMDAESILGSNEANAHLFRATAGTNTERGIVPFPIQMFDSREGQYYDERSTTYYTDLQKLPRNGVMSMIDVDVANLRRFFRGDFNGLFPTSTPFAAANGGVGLRNTDVPQREGWVIYVSDRRGDDDFDGELDMEDIYSAAPGNGGTMQPGEDVNNDGILNASYGTASGGETERYNTSAIQADLAAVQNHKYYRRGVRLINAATVPGIYDSATPANTRGISFASENGMYTLGNFNATGIGTVPATGNSSYDQYLPFNTANHIPASIVGDAVTILSNAWNDAQSFRTPTDGSNHGGRQASDTQIRFAMIAGDTLTSLSGSPNQGGGDPRLNGGLHNFKRFLEDWGGNRLDYTGSLINLFNSRNNNGSYKCCNTVYSPPRRNWVFDSTFLDPARLPPGTPFFQYVQTTGFQRTND